MRDDTDGNASGIGDDREETRPGAVSAGGPGSSGGASGPRRPKESESSRRYVTAVLESYRWLPGTPRATSRQDRRCAQALFRRGVPLEVVRAALSLGVARRTFRHGSPLPCVRALAYFLPVIEELEELPCDPDYARHLEQKLESLAAAKARSSSQPP